MPNLGESGCPGQWGDKVPICCTFQRCTAPVTTAWSVHVSTCACMCVRVPMNNVKTTIELRSPLSAWGFFEGTACLHHDGQVPGSQASHKHNLGQRSVDQVATARPVIPGQVHYYPVRAAVEGFRYLLLQEKGGKEEVHTHLQLSVSGIANTVTEVIQKQLEILGKYLNFRGSPPPACA